MSKTEYVPGYLPVFDIRYNILEYFHGIYPGFAEELKWEINQEGGIKSNIEYNNNRAKIEYPAEITEERKIVVYEPYFAYMWCICYAVVTFYNERESKDIDPHTNPRLAAAIDLLKYGFSLKDQWTEWPAGLPDPNKKDFFPYVDQANGVMVIASSYIIAHEYGHHFLGHPLDDAFSGDGDPKEDEFAADKYACEVLIDGSEESNISKNHTIRVAIIVGLGSILMQNDNWRGGPAHPDIDQRLYRILSYLEPEPDGEYWKWGLLMLFMWNVAYRNENFDSSGHGSAKADYEFLENYLRSNQRPAADDSMYYS